MRSVSNEYLEAIRARTRVDKLTGTIQLKGGTSVPLSDQNIPQGGVRIMRECVTGEELEFGSVTLAQLDLSLRTDQDRYAFYGATIYLTYSVQLSDLSWQK